MTRTLLQIWNATTIKLVKYLYKFPIKIPCLASTVLIDSKDFQKLL